MQSLRDEGKVRRDLCRQWRVIGTICRGGVQRRKALFKNGQIDILIIGFNAVDTVGVDRSSNSIAFTHNKKHLSVTAIITQIHSRAEGTMTG